MPKKRKGIKFPGLLVLEAALPISGLGVELAVSHATTVIRDGHGWSNVGEFLVADKQDPARGTSSILTTTLL